MSYTSSKANKSLLTANESKVPVKTTSYPFYVSLVGDSSPTKKTNFLLCVVIFCHFYSRTDMFA